MSIKKFLPAILWFLIILVLLCLPGSSIPKYSFLSLPYADKYIHISLFGILCFLFSLPFKTSSVKNTERKKWFLFITIGAILYGTIMEFVQKNWIPNRSFEWMDIAADSVGCLLALWVSTKKFLQKG